MKTGSLSEFALKVLEGLERQPVGDLHAFAESGDTPVWIAEELNELRGWLRLGGTRRPEPPLTDAVLGFGKTGAESLFRAYEREHSPEQSLKLLRALGRFIQHAEGRGLVTWNLNDLKLAPAAPGSRFLLSVTPELDARFRAAAQLEGQTLSDFARLAIADRCMRVEQNESETKTTA